MSKIICQLKMVMVNMVNKSTFQVYHLVPSRILGETIEFINNHYLVFSSFIFIKPMENTTLVENLMKMFVDSFNI